MHLALAQPPPARISRPDPFGRTTVRAYITACSSDEPDTADAPRQHWHSRPSRLRGMRIWVLEHGEQLRARFRSLRRRLGCRHASATMAIFILVRSSTRGRTS